MEDFFTYIADNNPLLQDNTVDSHSICDSL